MQNLNVALVQTPLFWEDKDTNKTYLSDLLLDRLKNQTIDLVILPEMFTTGFSMNPENLAEDMQGETVMWMRTIANDLGCHIGGSVIIQENGKFYNRFIVTNEEGVVSFYDKRHLFRMANEHDTYHPGSKRVVLELFGWKILLQVCYDLRFPVFARNRLKNGNPEYDLVIYTANWPEKRSAVWQTLLHARAIENQAFCVGVNRVGEDANSISYSGDSLAIDPWGNTIYQSQQHALDIAIIELKSSMLDNIREHFPAFKDSDNFFITDKAIKYTEE